MGKNMLGKSFVLAVATALLVAGGFGLGSLLGQRDTSIPYWGTAEDPPAGTPVELPTEDVFGQRLDLASDKVLLILAGVCSNCTLQPLRQGNLPYDRFDRVLMVYESPADEVRTLMEDTQAQHHPRLAVVADPEGRLATSLNALWDGRWAVVQGGELTKLQRDPSDASF